MSKFDVKFVIEAQNLGDATNRAMVALYKGDLDATEVQIVARDDKQTFTFADKARETHPSSGIVKREPFNTVPGPVAHIDKEDSLKNVVDINSKRK